MVYLAVQPVVLCLLSSDVGPQPDGSSTIFVYHKSMSNIAHRKTKTFFMNWHICGTTMQKYILVLGYPNLITNPCLGHFHSLF